MNIYKATHFGIAPQIDAIREGGDINELYFQRNNKPSFGIIEALLPHWIIRNFAWGFQFPFGFLQIYVTRISGPYGPLKF